MKLVASALALLLLGAGSIFLWKDASAQEELTRAGVIVSADAAPAEAVVAAGDAGAQARSERQTVRDAKVWSQALTALKEWNAQNPVVAAAEKEKADQKAAAEKADQEKAAAEKAAQEKAAQERAAKEKAAKEKPPAVSPPRAVSPPPVAPGDDDDDDDDDDDGWDDDDDDDWED